MNAIGKTDIITIAEGKTGGAHEDDCSAETIEDHGDEETESCEVLIKNSSWKGNCASIEVVGLSIQSSCCLKQWPTSSFLLRVIVVLIVIKLITAG